MKRIVLIGLLIMISCVFALPGTCLADEGVASKTINVEPIPPEQLTESVEKVGENIISLGQGAAPSAGTIGIIVAALLIFVGLPLLGITKSVFKAGISMLFGVAILYVLVFHSGPVIGIIKGIFNVQ